MFSVYSALLLQVTCSFKQKLCIELIYAASQQIHHINNPYTNPSGRPNLSPLLVRLKTVACQRVSSELTGKI